MTLWIALGCVIALALVLLFVRGASLASRDLSESTDHTVKKQPSANRVA